VAPDLETFISQVYPGIGLSPPRDYFLDLMILCKPAGRVYSRQSVSADHSRSVEGSQHIPGGIPSDVTPTRFTVGRASVKTQLSNRLFARYMPRLMTLPWNTHGCSSDVIKKGSEGQTDWRGTPWGTCLHSQLEPVPRAREDRAAVILYRRNAQVPV